MPIEKNQLIDELNISPALQYFVALLQHDSALAEYEMKAKEYVQAVVDKSRVDTALLAEIKTPEVMYFRQRDVMYDAVFEIPYPIRQNILDGYKNDAMQRASKITGIPMQEQDFVQSPSEQTASLSQNPSSFWNATSKNAASALAGCLVAASTYYLLSNR